MHVINPHAYPFGDKYTALDAARFMDEAAQAAQKQMRRMGARPACGIPGEVRRGSSAIEICKAANEDAGLIVTSTHGRTGLGHVFIGSTAQRVVRYARCPVLVISTRPKSRKK